MKNKSTKQSNALIRLSISFFLLINFLIAPRLIAQMPFVCGGVDYVDSVPGYSPPQRPASANCGAVSPAYAKYSNESTYIPNVLDPLVTLKITLHIFQDNLGNGPYQSSDIPTIKSYMQYVVHSTNIAYGNTERYSQVRSANYTVPGFSSPTTIIDGKIRYELTNIYFYKSTSCYTNNPFGGTNAVANWLNANYPAQFQEGIPIIYTNGNTSPFTRLTPMGPAVYTSFLDSAFVGTNLRHELGHATGLGHPYEYKPTGQIGELTAPNVNSAPAHNPYYFPCGDPNYLDDVFPANNPNCPMNPAPYTLVANACASCMEYTYWSNNIMNNESSKNRWMSNKQMGRRIMQLHLPFFNGISLRPYVKDMSSPHQNPWIISSNEVWDFDMQMYKDIVVNPGVSLTIQCKVAMPIDGRIIVEKGGQLIIDGGEVTTWCKSGLWWGIQVAGDPLGDQTINAAGYGNNQGMLRVINSGTVSLAGNGASNYKTDAAGNILWSTVGGIIITKNASFINNSRDVQFLAYGPQQSASIFTNTQFLTKAFVNGQTSIFAHVTMWAVRGVKFIGCNFAYNAGPTNWYNTRGFGIYSMDAAFTVDHWCSTPGCASGPYTPCTFQNLYKGVVADNFNPLSGSASIYNSQFLDQYLDGIYLHNMYYPMIDNNYIRTTAGFPTGSGIYLNTCKRYLVKRNTLIQGGSTFNPTDPGIYAYNSQEGSHMIYKNNFNHFYSAVNAVDNNSGVGNFSDGLQIYCNDFSPGRSLYDIAMTGFGTGANIPTVKLLQGSPYGGNATAVRNIYAALCGNQNQWYMVPSCQKNVAHYSSADAVAQPTPQPSCSNPLVNVYSTGQMMNYTQDCPDSPPSSGGSNTLTPPQRLNNINQYIQTLQANNGDPFELQAAVAAKIKYYIEDTLLSSQDTVINILTRNPGQMADADIQLIFAYLGKNNYTQATTLTNALASNRADWKALLLNLIAIYQEPDKIFSLLRTGDNNYKSFMTELAAANYKDGQGIAQSLLKFVCGIDYTEPRPLPGQASTGGREANSAALNGAPNVSKNSDQIQVYPNPTQTDITIAYDASEDQKDPVKVQLTDLVGKVIYTNFISNIDKGYISLSDYANGVYIITVTRNKELIYKSKIIKQN